MFHHKLARYSQRATKLNNMLDTRDLIKHQGAHFDLTNKAVNKLTCGSLGLVSHGSESDMIFFPRLRVKIKKSMIDL